LAKELAERPPVPIETKDVHYSKNARSVVQDIMREKGMSRYVELICGHFTTWEDIELYRTFQTKKDRFLCSTCHKWRDKKPPPKKEPIPDEPMF
jgi:hypothetical protein